MSLSRLVGIPNILNPLPGFGISFRRAGDFILSLTHYRILSLLIINLFLLFVGCFLEPVAAMIILIYVFFSSARK